MATVPQVTSGSGLRKFQADGFFSPQSVHNIVAWRLSCIWGEVKTRGLLLDMCTNCAYSKNLTTKMILRQINQR